MQKLYAMAPVVRKADTKVYHHVLFSHYKFFKNQKEREKNKQSEPNIDET